MSCQRYHYRTGDLIFQDLDCKLCDAIEHATSGYQNKPVSHMGMIVVTDSGTFVLEAYDQVQLISLDTFIKRSEKIMIGRLKKPYRKFIPAAKSRGIKKLELPYDDVFRLNNGKYYCSELIYDIFLDENKLPIFEIKPMNFKNLKTGKIDPVWIEYFQGLGIPVPQGEPGCNPADYSKSDKIHIIKIAY